MAHELNLEPNIVTDASKPSVGDIVRNHQSVVEKIMSTIRVVYQTLVADNKISDKAIAVLAETVSRVTLFKDQETLEKKLTLTAFPKPEDLYLWAIANSSIVFPYCSLKVAEENMKDTTYTPRTWGYKDGTFILPKKESCEDSRTWKLLGEIFKAYCKEGSVLFTADFDESMPALSNDECAKNETLDTVMIRLLELTRSPGSVTLRTSITDRKEIIKNAVDFVILEDIYKDNEKYINLTLSGACATAGRRAERIQTGTAGKKLTYTTVFLGFKLAELLAPFLKTRKAKTLESETFVQMMVSFIKLLKPDSSFSLPKTMFEAPSNQLRSRIRLGPKIKTKVGERSNLYTPFSFVKASDAISYPEIHKKTLIKAGSSILMTLDTVNKLSIVASNNMLPVAKDYLSTCYTISDEIRKQWKKNQMIVDSEQVEDLMINQFPGFDKDISEWILKVKRESLLLSYSKLNGATSPEIPEKEVAAVKPIPKSGIREFPLKSQGYSPKGERSFFNKEKCFKPSEFPGMSEQDVEHAYHVALDKLDYSKESTAIITAVKVFQDHFRTHRHSLW